MKKNLLFFVLLIIISCESDNNSSVCDIINNQTINLNNPEFINLQVTGGWAYANGGPRGLVIYSYVNSYKAFSRECPTNSTCNEQMIVENDIKMVCPCDANEYSILDGSPLTEGISESVCEFRVVEVGSSTLTITNF